jgi:asparagine synthase (glutamine-hydrolysing)
MCGILFQFFKDGRCIDGESFKSALEIQAHRGPDGRHALFEDGAALGSARLAIIDLNARANQPMVDPTGRWALTMNGEIYNYRQLRTRLQAMGVEFRTQSDTEVLLASLIRLGVDETLRRVRGMFAFVLYDRQERRFVGARDHFGQKPFYYLAGSSVFACSSDVRSFFSLGLRPNIDLSACALYLCTNGIIEPDATFFQGVQALPAGYLIEGCASGWSVRRYFDVLELVDAHRRSVVEASDESAASAELEQHLRVAIDRHLVSDVPVGVLLSGGIDSSLAYWLATDTGTPLTTFTKVCPGIETIPMSVVPSLLERRPSPSHFCEESPETYLPGLVDFVRVSHAPARWGGGPPMYHLCRTARESGVTVLLGGDGVDEYAAGYRTIPELLDQYNGDPCLLHELVDARPWDPSAAHPRMLAFQEAQKAAKRRLYDALAHVGDARERFAEATLLQDLELFLQTCALPNSDAYSMMASVELRNPFLDIDLIRFMVNQPFRRKLDGKGGACANKALFRQTARRLMGQEIDVPKEGTRNYSKAVSDPRDWDLRKFEIARQLPLPPEPTWRHMFKILNLEIFWRLFENGSEVDLDSLRTERKSWPRWTA